MSLALFFAMIPASIVRDVALDGGAGLVEQRGLLQHLVLFADAALGAHIGGIGVAAPVRAEIGLGLDEGAGTGDHVEDALVEPLRLDRLGPKFSEARLP